MKRICTVYLFCLISSVTLRFSWLAVKVEDGKAMVLPIVVVKSKIDECRHTLLLIARLRYSTRLCLLRFISFKLYR
jgi:hypothetical protein